MCLIKCEFKIKIIGPIKGVMLHHMRPQQQRLRGSQLTNYPRLVLPISCLFDLAETIKDEVEMMSSPWSKSAMSRLTLHGQD